MKNTNIRKRKKAEPFVNNEYIQYLRKDCVNVFHVPVGKMPRGKAEAYLQNFIERSRDITEGYKIIFLAKFDD